METSSGRLSVTAFDFSGAHYQALVDLQNQVWISHPWDVLGTRIFDQNNSKKELLRYLFYQGQACIGFGELRQSDWTPDPRNYTVQIIVDIKYRQRGFGNEIWDFLMNRQTKVQIATLQSDTNSLEVAGMHFMESKGFKLGTTEFVSRLNLEVCSMDKTDHPLQFISYAELESEGYNRRDLYKLLSTLDRDIPWHDTHEPETYAQWDHRTSSQNNVLAKHSFLALAPSGDLIGCSELETRVGATQDALYTGLTGVLKGWRRQGIAMALKKRCLRTIKETKPDVKYIWTENEEKNPMFVINQKLGFERQYDLLFYERILRSGQPSAVSIELGE